MFGYGRLFKCKARSENLTIDYLTVNGADIVNIMALVAYGSDSSCDSDDEDTPSVPKTINPPKSGIIINTFRMMKLLIAFHSIDIVI